jgi:hypothetical protein
MNGAFPRVKNPAKVAASRKGGKMSRARNRDAIQADRKKQTFLLRLGGCTFDEIAGRRDDFPHERFPTVGEILTWASEPDGAGFRLRAPQVRALEVYWYLRLVEGTPKIADLYEKYFPAADDPDAHLKALGIPQAAFQASKYNVSTLRQRIASNDDFVRDHSLQALRETLALEYAPRRQWKPCCSISCRNAQASFFRQWSTANETDLDSTDLQKAIWPCPQARRRFPCSFRSGFEERSC